MPRTQKGYSNLRLTQVYSELDRRLRIVEALVRQDRARLEKIIKALQALAKKLS